MGKSLTVCERQFWDVREEFKVFNYGLSLPGALPWDKKKPGFLFCVLWMGYKYEKIEIWLGKR